MNVKRWGQLTVLAFSGWLAVAQAQTVHIGVSVSSTGPAASLGIPEKNTVSIAPTNILPKGTQVEYIVLDDATDTASAVRNMRKLISEHKVDVMIGSSITAASLAMVDVGAETQTPLISLAGNAVVVTPPTGSKKWAFKSAPNDALMAQAMRQAMVKAGVKRVGYMGFADAYGTSWYQELEKALKGSGIQIVANESFGRNDTSVTGQVIKVLSKKPDAVVIGTAGTPGALPQRELIQRGFKGISYHTHGSANNDFLRVCGKACENIVMPIGPLTVADQLPAGHPSKAVGLAYTQLYNDKFGANTVNSFGGLMWDALTMAQTAVAKALKEGKTPGTPEFRQAVRQALENTQNVVGVNGVFNMSPQDHAGLDDRARVLVTVKNGHWVYAPELQ